MMNLYHDMKEKVISINDETGRILNRLIQMSEITPSTSTRWNDTLAIVSKQISEEMFRVAVAGAIKSGKSTVANRLIGGDFLRRGAGVVTSVVTRIHKGSCLKAKILLKSWEEINRDIDQAILFFPSLSYRPESGAFDIRRDQDRENLKAAMSRMDEALHLTQDARNEHSVFLTSYLKGYDEIIRITGRNRYEIEYAGDRFHEHGRFSGNEVLASYVKDMEIEVHTGNMDASLELADCQGSDSPNPFHLAQVQDYLMKTNLVLYVISSRTGLRREDIRFLSMIREMGVLDHILFVVNVDFNEHGSMKDLERVMQKIRDEISLVKKDPEIYAFSGLFMLFQILPELTDAKDRQKYELWKGETELGALNETQFNAFMASFSNTVSRKRYALLLRNSLEKINIVIGGVLHLVSLNLELVKNDSLNVQLIQGTIKGHQKKMDQVQRIVVSTLEGEIHKLKRLLSHDIDGVFDEKYGEIMPGVMDFIHGYAIDYSLYKDHFRDVGFANTLYLIFREFKKALDSYMTETVNPKIFKFSKSVETTIEETLQSVASPFDSVIRDTIDAYQNSMDQAGLSFVSDLSSDLSMPAIDSVKTAKGLGLPASGAITQYGTLIKTEAFFRYGVYKAFDYLRNLITRNNSPREKDGARALVSGMKRIKRETVKSIRFYFLNYRENLKFKYIFALAEAYSQELTHMLNDRFNRFSGDIETLSKRIEKRGVIKESDSELFLSIRGDATSIRKQVSDIKREIDDLLTRSRP